MRNKFSKLVLAATFGFALSCGPTVPYTYTYTGVDVFVKLRPDLTENDSEVWEVLGQESLFSEGAPSYNNLTPAMKEKAAVKSEIEGYDCFIILSESDASRHSSYTRTEKKTMNGTANTFGSANYYSNYNSGYINSYGNSYDNTSYSYEVPVTKTSNLTSSGLIWIVSFKKANVCEEFKKSKWRENVYYNKDYWGFP